MILILIVVVLIMLWGKAFLGSRKAHKQGEIYLKAHQYIQAVTYFDRSIHWYAPFNPYVRRSAELLWEIGDHAEKEGDIKLALIAFRAIRRGFIAASHVVVPGRGWIEKCEARINDLMALEKKESGGMQTDRPPDVIIPQNQKSEPPNVFWSIILEVGLLGWVGSVIGFILFPLKQREKTKKWIFSTFIWSGLAIISFILWIIGMMRA